jgi:hypothetical protein
MAPPAQPRLKSPRAASPWSARPNRRARLRLHHRESPLRTGNTGTAITPLADFSLPRMPLFKNHLRHPAAPIPPPAVRFGQAENDNQSAGKLRLGFHPSTQPVVAPFAAAQAPRLRSSTTESTRERRPHDSPQDPATHAGSLPQAPKPDVRKKLREPDKTGQLGTGTLRLSYRKKMASFESTHRARPGKPSRKSRHGASRGKGPVSAKRFTQPPRTPRAPALHTGRKTAKSVRSVRFEKLFSVSAAFAGRSPRRLGLRTAPSVKSNEKLN